MQTYKAGLLSTAAAALLLSAGAASAQMNPAQPERAPAAQRSAPAERMAPPMNAGERKAPETTGQAQKGIEPGQGRSAPAGAAQAPGADSKTLNKDGKAEMKGSADTKGSADMKAPANDKAAQDKAAQDKAGSGAKSTQSGDSTTQRSTTGQGAAAGAAKLSVEQRTKITSVIKQQKVQSVSPSQLNVSISVGTRVPRTVRYYPLPQEVIVIYPEWRGYSYILVGSQIVIIEPSTYEIVAILDA